MFTNEVKIRVRYAETDQMNVVYHGNYAQYFEVARVETMRSLGISYKEMEDNGIMLPVLELNIKYVKPAYYDDILTVRTEIREIPSIRVIFYYEIFRKENEILTIGNTTLVFFDIKKKKPTPAPDYITEKLQPYFKDRKIEK